MSARNETSHKVVQALGKRSVMVPGMKHLKFDNGSIKKMR